MELLCSTQFEALRELEIAQFVEDGIDSIKEGFKKLQSLKAHSFHTSRPSSICRVISDSAKTLRSLSLGSTAAVANLRRIPLAGGSDKLAILKRLAVEMADLIALARLDVHHLEFIGLDVQCDSWVNQFCNVFNTTKLQSLSLLSCLNLDTFWNSFQAHCSLTKAPERKFLNLTSLTLRLQGLPDGSKTTMEKFLKSFCGLHHLYILLDESWRLPDVGVITENHGSTLRTLVIDARRETQNNPFIPTAVRFGDNGNPASAFTKIVDRCPELVELGIAINWEILDEVRSYKTGSLIFIRSETQMRLQVGTLYRCRRLRTLNIRNPPVPVKQLVGVTEDTRVYERQALDLLECMMNRQIVDTKCPNDIARPRLDTLAIGASTYKTIYADTALTGPDQAQRRWLLEPKYYCVEYLCNVHREWTPVLTRIGRGSPVGLQYYTNHTRILEPYWIN